MISRTMSPLIFGSLAMLACGCQNAFRPSVWVDAAAPAAKATGAAHAPFQSIRAAIENAPDRGVIHVMPGVYQENIVLSRGISIRGEVGRSGQGIPVLEPLDRRGAVVTMRGQATLSRMRVISGWQGVLVTNGTKARIVHCEIVGHGNDGVAFEQSGPKMTPADVYIEDCLIADNKEDGIDLDATLGIATKCRITRNGDDGIDYDGDTNFQVVDNEITHNGDDGIEIRLSKLTRGTIRNNMISDHSEDGVEIIAAPTADKISSSIRIFDNVIRRNQRYGVGGVDSQTENVEDGLQLTGITLRGNKIVGNGKDAVAGIAAKWW